MDLERLVELGFNVTGADEHAKATAELMTPLVNPLTRDFIQRAEFRVVDERLVPTAPPELVGLPPQAISGVTRFSDFEAQLRSEFDRAILQMQRRSADLQTLGIQPVVDPASLELWADVRTATLQLRIAADKQGTFRVVEATRGTEKLKLPSNVAFELAEFRESAALLGYLETLVLELSGGARPEGVAGVPAAAPKLVRPLTLNELADRFGGRAVVPQKTPVEIVADLRVGGDRYRFAASRVLGRTFRGLLAGPRGKVWADRFELDAFPGVVALTAERLGVPPESVELVGLEVPGST